METKENLSKSKGETTIKLREITVSQLLSESVNKFQDKIALVFEYSKNEVTKTGFREFENMVNSISAAFIDIGIRKSDFIGVWSIDCLETIVCLFALQKIGAVTVNFFPYFGSIEFQDAMLRTKCKGIIISNGLTMKDQSRYLKDFIPDLKPSESNPNQVCSELFPDLKIIISNNKDNFIEQNQCPYLHYSSVKLIGDELLKNGFKLSEYESLVSCHDPSQILFSSGSTGKQKMILHNQFFYTNNPFFYAQRVGFTPNDVAGNVGPMYLGIGKVFMLASLIAGSTMVFLPFDSVDKTQLIESIEKYSISVIKAPPTIFQNILNNPRLKQVNIRSLKKGIISSFHGNINIYKDIKTVLGMEQCIHGFGMSEIGLGLSTFRDSPIDTFINTSGTVLPHTSAKIINTDGSIVPIGEIGQLCFKSYSVMLEYYGDEKKTTDSFINGWFKSGDLAKMDKDGNFTIIGRMDDIFKTRQGHLVPPKEVEDFLNTHPKIKDSQVFGIPYNESQAHEIVAWIILKNESDSITLDEINSYFIGKTSFFKIPTHIEIVSEFPLNSTLKPSKKLMKEITIKKLSLSHI
eukprot:gene4329-5419_t